MKLSAILTLALLIAHSVCRAEAPVAFHGTVVGSDTRKPIPGAVIVVVWRKKYLWEMDGGGTVQRIVESETDAEGRFSVPDEPGFSLLGRIREPWVVIYYPHYRPYPYLPSPILSDDYKPPTLQALLVTTKQGNDELRRGATITLTRLPRGRELEHFLSPGTLGIPGQIRLKSLPLLRALLNRQRSELGKRPL